MAKFNVGDLVDWRNPKTLEVWEAVYVAEESPLYLASSDRGGAPTWDANPDDCIPHVPAPVVQPAPVDPLTGLTAQEMERRYSARLSAFGRGEADPFVRRHDDECHCAKCCAEIALVRSQYEIEGERFLRDETCTEPEWKATLKVRFVGTMGGDIYGDRYGEDSARLSAFGRGEADPFGPRLVRVESVGPAPKITFVDDCGSPNHVCDLCCGPAEGPVPRPLTIEDVKVGSRALALADLKVRAVLRYKGRRGEVEIIKRGGSTFWLRSVEHGTTWTARPEVILAIYEMAE